MKDLLKGIVFVGLFAIPFIPLIVVDSMFFPFITGKNFAFRIIVEIIFGAWVLLALLDKTYRPRFSWVFAGLAGFLIVMFFANILGEYPLRSFWSNFERMDGYVTLVHFFLFFTVLTSTFKADKKLWMYFLWTSVAAAGYAAFDGLQQFLTQEGTRRLDSTLGNAAYMAVYMLFHIFFSVYLFFQSKEWWARSISGIFFVLFVSVLMLTATRGTFIGLITGLSVTAVYLLVFSRGYPFFRKVAAGILVVLVLGVSAIFAFKETQFVQESKAFKRFANIDLQEDLAVRFDIWEMAYEGWQERPILGWGQGNFNYVFNKTYNPDLYFAEAWYDRAHNIFLDWLVAGGVLAVIAYMGVFIALLYYLLIRPIITLRRSQVPDASDDAGELLSVPERAVLFGLLAGYFTHNLVVFDNIVSYIFFGVTLALIHGHIGREMPKVQAFEIDPRIVTNIAAPVVAVCIGTIVYFVNVPGIMAAGDIIDALTAQTIPERQAEMESAIERDAFAYQEIVEQFAQQAMQISANPNIAPQQKQEFIERAERELLGLAAQKPDDARVHVFISGFYRNVGALEQAKEHADIAHQLSPTKQAVILEQGIIAYQMQDFEAMRDYFKQAFELQPEYHLTRIFYASSLMYTGETDRISEVITTDEEFDRFAMNDFALQSANQFGRTDLLMRMYESRIKQQPNNAQHYASLAFLHYEAEDSAAAIDALQRGVDAVDSFATTGACYIENIEAGNEPSEGCEE